jgi:chromosome segregation ATPase
VYPKRFAQDDDQTTPDDAPVAAETLRSAAAAPATKEEEKMSIFWRVFGGTILSIVALVSITLFNNIQSSLSELRSEAARTREALAGAAKREDLEREREARGGMARKEDIDARIKTQYERIRVIEGYKTDIETMKERAGVATAAVEGLKKEVSTSVDALKRDTATIEILRERLTVLSAETKLATEAVQRVQAEVEKNRAADLERKVSRDTQARSIDDSMRELQRAVQDCREKLARLEGAAPPAPTPARPREKSEKSE